MLQARMASELRSHQPVQRRIRVHGQSLRCRFRLRSSASLLRLSSAACWMFRTMWFLLIALRSAVIRRKLLCIYVMLIACAADRLTMLGPMCIIASLSLGATRTFRIRRVGASASETVDPSDEPGPSPPPLQPGHPAAPNRAHRLQQTSAVQQSPAVGVKRPGGKVASKSLTTVDVELKHNSLLIMWPPMQEEWKHEVSVTMSWGEEKCLPFPYAG